MPKGQLNPFEQMRKRAHQDTSMAGEWQLEGLGLVVWVCLWSLNAPQNAKESLQSQEIQPTMNAI